MSEVRDGIRGILVKYFQVDEKSIRDDVSLESLGLDSIMLIELGDHISEHFGLVVSEDDMFDAKTFAGLLETVRLGRVAQP